MNFEEFNLEYLKAPNTAAQVGGCCCRLVSCHTLGDVVQETTMSQLDATLKLQIAANLEHLGFEVLSLQESKGVKTPDLLARSQGERFLFEIKSKHDDEEGLARQRARSAAGEIAEWSHPWSPRNTISGVIREGVEQLSAFPIGDYDYSLLWLHAQGRDPESQFQQFAHTLFGLTQVFSLTDSNFNYECYYFHESAFFSLRGKVDGAIISTPTKAQLCLNTYSPRADGMRRSSLARALGSGLRDPEALDAEGKAILADCDVDRHDAAAVISYLQQKYNTQLLQHMHVGRLSAWVDLDTVREGSPNPPAGADG